MVAAPPPSSSEKSFPQPNSHSFEQMSEEDAIQAAIAMSLGLPDSVAPSTTTTGTTPTTTTEGRLPPVLVVPPLDVSEDNHLQLGHTSDDGKNTSTSSSLKNFLLQFHSIMWDRTTTENDQYRWIHQGIHYADSTGTSSSNNNTQPITSEADRLKDIVSSHGPWGLQQQHGGPCGVLAAIQAELLRSLLFSNNNNMSLPYAMASSMATILARVASAPPVSDNQNVGTKKSQSVVIFLADTPLERSDLAPWTEAEARSDVHATTSNITMHRIPLIETSPTTLSSKGIDDGTYKRPRTDGGQESLVESLEDRIRNFLLTRLHVFERQGGVLLFVMSCVLSRGIEILRSEFDDPTGTRLTAQFGHCGQELMNLLLTGQAVSNVFDNTMKMTEEMSLRGIQCQPAIGYLTQLEALRYCEVGTYYKSPKYPIWVVGSTSHFTVLFGGVEAMKESQSDVVLDECRRAFKSLDSDNGFIQISDLGKLLDLCNIELNESQISVFAATVEVSGAGIILWDDFWKIASRLKTGASIESVLQNGDEDEVQLVDTPASVSPVTRVQHGRVTHETDEEMAKRLAVEWEPQGMAALTQAASVVEKPMTDEELARKLQAEWDAELSGSNSVAAVDGSPNRTPSPSIDGDLPSLEPVTDYAPDQDSKPSAQSELEFEKFGDTFSLYHYNGLRGGTLTEFRVTRLSPEEAVGASIALNRSSNAGGGDLEDVVRTKWPSCMINWLGKSSPYID